MGQKLTGKKRRFESHELIVTNDLMGWTALSLRVV